MKSTPRLEELIRIGYIKKSHGINGALSFCFDEDFHQDLQKDIDFIFLNINNLAVPYPLESGTLDTSSCKPFHIIRLRWIDDVEKASTLSTSGVYVEKKYIIERKINNDEMEVSDFVGYTLQSGSNIVGRIEAVNDYSGNVVMEVNKGGRIIDIPFVDKYFDSFNKDSNTLIINYPQEMLDALTENN
ncbi:MAG: ribosome maturation factor RimM [Bacteroidales bacterium]